MRCASFASYSRRGLWALILFGSLTGSFVALQAYTFTGGTWASRQVPFYINPVNADGVADADVEAAITQGAANWSMQSNADFQFYYAGRTNGSALQNNGKNEVFFRNESNGGTIALTYWWTDSGGRLVDADIVYYDAAFKFFGGSTGCSGGIYIQDTGTHEFGHALGLHHSSVGGSTMYASTTWCSQNERTLDADDIAGIEALYPPGGTTSTPPTAPSNATASTSTVSDPSSQIRVTWVDNASSEDYFYVERSPDQVSWMQFRVSANATSYTDSGLDGDTTYSYRVRANNSAGNSAYSNIASATTSTTTLAAATTPTAPTNPSPGNSATGVNENSDLAWGGSAQTYDVYFWQSSQAKPSSPYRTGLTSTFLSLPKLGYSTRYSWQVVARNGSLVTTGNTWTFTTRARGKK